ncbi:MAG: hypothetical protein CMA22_01065 [Euryarchaeota archaeon]|nr:hypothetical protein [Euryarchaeota archaeon]
MGWLGLDDTDHLGGGCTTKTLDLLIQGLPSDAEIGEIRLVRLWPFAKQRTRGNASVAVEINCNDEEKLLKHLDSWWNEKISPLAGEVSSTENYDRQQYPAEPGMVWFSSQIPSVEFYYNTVRREVNIDEVPIATKTWGGQGRIGATAAIAWDKMQVTYEAIAWRTEINTGNEKIRKIDAKRLEEIDKMEHTFMSRDSRTGNSMIAPRGPCPVLFGLRARNYIVAKEAAMHLLNSEFTEENSGVRVFTTNQASDDHLGENLTDVVMDIEVLSRGTVIINCKQNKLLAFSESGEIKLLAQWLKNGDLITFNGLINHEGVYHLERLRVEKSSKQKIRPLCEKCNVKMKSMGKNQPVRCPKCREKSDQLWTEVSRTPPMTGWVQAPMDSRRHLTKPLEWS